MMMLENRAVIVTGAGAGLGREYALAAAAAGADVVVNDRDAPGAEATAGRIVAAGGRAVACTASVARPGTGQLLVDHCLEAFGRVDGLVTNAGVLAPGRPITQSRAEVVAAFETNVFGVIECAVPAMRVMLAAGSGSIVNVVSGSMQGLDGLSLYGATKGAVMGLSYGWALELAGSGVRVNAISPLAHTGMSDLMNIDDAFKGGPPQRVAPAVVALLSDRTAGITGQLVRFDGERLGLVAPPQLRAATAPRSWSAEAIADALGTPLAPWLQPLGLAASPPPAPVD